MLGVPFGWHRGEGDWTGVSAAIVNGEPVQVIQAAGCTLWQSHLPQGHSFYFQPAPPTPKAKIWISPLKRLVTENSSEAKNSIPEVQWHPRVLWVGIGCERGTSRQVIETAIQQACLNIPIPNRDLYTTASDTPYVLSDSHMGDVFSANENRYNHLASGAIAGIATIDLKADEVGLVELCRARNWPLRTFPSAVLCSVSVPNPSAVVEAEVGTPSVAEAAALYAARGLAVDSKPNTLVVSKQIFRSEGQPGAVTVAIAQAELEYTGRTGCLLLVGTGPGQLDQMTPAAQTAVTQADAVIGYSLYIQLIAPLLQPTQIVEALPITKERLRAQRAIELAQWGLTVAVVSSGDCGIYGMAGLVLEELQEQGWDGKTPGVRLFPGITALQAAAARVGTPLMHDFCAISLSDLLTPWEVIEKRLAAAAEADFVTALYNPRSQTRIQQMALARTIFLKYRDPNTPVAVVRSASRQWLDDYPTRLFRIRGRVPLEPSAGGLTHRTRPTMKLSPLATKVRTIEPIKAGPNPTMLKPGVSTPASQMVIALTTKRNSPRVTIVSGSVKSTKIGLTMALTSPKTTAAIKAATKLLTTKPGTI